MFASTGTSTAEVTFSSSLTSRRASGKIASAPASTYALARSIVAYRLGGFDHLLAFQVPATFRVHLVLDVAAGQAGVLEHLDGAGRVHRFAEAGVGVHDRG